MTARSTAEARRLEPTGIVTFRQADVGEYLREVRLRRILGYGGYDCADTVIGGYAFYDVMSRCA